MRSAKKNKKVRDILCTLALVWKMIILLQYGDYKIWTKCGQSLLFGEDYDKITLKYWCDNTDITFDYV